MKQAAKSIRVLVVEDHPAVRAGIRAMLDLFHNVEWVGEATNGEQALTLISQDQPDVVLLDVSTRGLDGITTAGQIRDRFPSVKLIMLSLHEQAHHVKLARQLGVSGYLVKGLADELEPALRTVAAGGTFFSRTLPSVGAGAAPLPVGRKKKSVALTPRQLQILRLIAKGLSTKEIGNQLGISFKTAQTHRTELMQRLDIHKVADLVRYAIRNGLITSEK
jgi:DNA-binding NarL/FixJ family response regulator